MISISIFLNLLRHCGPALAYERWCSVYAWKECLFDSSWVKCLYTRISVRSNCLIVLPNSSRNFPNFSLSVLSIIEGEQLISLTIIFECYFLSISLFLFGVLLLDVYIHLSLLYIPDILKCIFIFKHLLNFFQPVFVFEFKVYLGGIRILFLLLKNPIRQSLLFK